MGGSSSKSKRSRSKSNAADKEPKSMKKLKAKSKAKSRREKDTAQWTKVDDEVTFVSGYSRQDSSSSSAMTTGPAVPRPRAKSLRFGDFAQLDRLHKVDDGEFMPLDIAFFAEGKVQPEELCHVCSVYTGCETLLCGVCYRVYHQGCLSKIGQWSGPPDLLTSASGMWTCHQCSNLGYLLTEEEVIQVLRRLDKCNIRREDDLSLSDYLAYCHMSLQEDEGKVLTRDKAENARKRFAQVQPDLRCRITWCQFLNIEAVRVLARRNKNALVRLLTAPEIERARDEFRILDTDMDGKITKATAHEALDRTSRKSGYYPDETMMYIDEDLNQSISWMEFLRDRAIYIIAERPCLRVSPLAQSTARRGSQRSSLSSATSLPVTPVSKTPPVLHPHLHPHGKGGVGLMGKVCGNALSSVPSSPGKQQSAGPASSQGPGLFRHSDSAPCSFRSYPNMAALAAHEPTREQNAGGQSPNSTGKKQQQQQQVGGLPLLPPPPPATSSSRSSAHHGRSSSAFAAKKSEPEVSCSAQARTSHSDCAPTAVMHAQFYEASSSSSGQQQRLSGGSESGRRPSSGGSSGGLPSSLGLARRPSQEAELPSGSLSCAAGLVVTGKPPLGSSPHGRAVAAPPFGNLVARVQKGDYRQAQARSMYLVSEGATYNAPVPSSFGTVTGDSNTGRRPLSLV